jgi:transposase
VIIMESSMKIRRQILIEGKSIRSVSRDTGISRNTIKKYLEDARSPSYTRLQSSIIHKLQDHKHQLQKWYEQDLQRPKKERRTAVKLYEQLQSLHNYTGSYSPVCRYIQELKAEPSLSKAFIPLFFDPGDAMQFDFSHETVVLDGIEQTVKIAHFRLCNSRKSFVIGYHRETVEMILDAFVQALEFYKGIPKRVIIDNPKTMVTKICKGKERIYHPRFLAMANHYLIEPVACTPASGWEKGQVEKQVNTIRCNFFTPKLHFDSLQALNAYLHASCIKLADKLHPDFKDINIADCFKQEQPYLQAPIRPFNAYIDKITSVNSTCQIRCDTNCYSVPSEYAGKLVTLLIYANNIKILHDNKVIAEHNRSFSRHRSIYDPFHYVPLLQRKPGALRNGAPFKDWQLPDVLELLKQHYLAQDKGDKEFIKLLMLIVTHDLETVVCACELAVEDKIYNLSVITNILYRLIDDDRYKPIKTEQYPVLVCPPVANCHRYDSLIGGTACNS